MTIVMLYNVQEIAALSYYRAGAMYCTPTGPTILTHRRYFSGTLWSGRVIFRGCRG